MILSSAIRCAVISAPCPLDGAGDGIPSSSILLSFFTASTGFAGCGADGGAGEAGCGGGLGCAGSTEGTREDLAEEPRDMAVDLSLCWTEGGRGSSAWTPCSATARSRPISRWISPSTTCWPSSVTSGFCSSSLALRTARHAAWSSSTPAPKIEGASPCGTCAISAASPTARSHHRTMPPATSRIGPSTSMPSVLYASSSTFILLGSSHFPIGSELPGLAPHHCTYVSSGQGRLDSSRTLADLVGDDRRSWSTLSSRRAISLRSSLLSCVSLYLPPRAESSARDRKRAWLGEGETFL
eukprot:3121770-Rhodomonas_salina.3